MPELLVGVLPWPPSATRLVASLCVIILLLLIVFIVLIVLSLSTMKLTLGRTMSSTLPSLGRASTGRLIIVFLHMKV